MTDRYGNIPITRTMPAEAYIAAILDTDLGPVDAIPRAIYIGGDGDVVAINDLGDPITFVGMKGGVIYPIRPNRINTTGTTATGILCLY